MLSLKYGELLKTYKNKNTELDALYAVASSVSESLDLATVLHCAIDKALEVTGLDGGAIYLFSQGGKNLDMRVHRNVPRVFLHQYSRLRKGEGVPGMAAQRGKPIWVEDVTSDPRHSTPNIKKVGIKFVIAIPLKTKDGNLGVLTLGSYQKMRFSEEQFGPLLAIGNQIGIAIENSHLHEKVKKQTERLEALHHIGAHISSTLDLKKVLTLILKSSLKMFGCSEGALAISDAVKKRSLGNAINDIRTEGFKNIRLPSAQKDSAGHTPDTRRSAILRKDGGFPVSSIMTSPLLLKNGKSLGILAVGSREPREFIKEEGRILDILGSQAAIAIENALFLEKAVHSREMLRRLTSQMIALQEKDRTRISRELHDEAGQGLEALKIDLKLLKNNFLEGSNEAQKAINRMESITDRILREIRRLIHDLRPAILDDLGILPAVRWYTKDFSRRYGIPVDFRPGENNMRISQEVKTVVYRIIQESLTNVAKHSGAGRTAVRISSKNGSILLSVEDNGKGFDVGKVMGTNHKSQGLGIIGIMERVSAMKGTLSLTSQPGEGTRLDVSLPVTHGKN